MNRDAPIDEAIHRLDELMQRFQAKRRDYRAYIARPSRAAHILDQEPRLSDSVDAACMGLASETGSHLLDETGDYLLYARFQQAHVFAHWIYGRVAFPERTAADILKLFLVDYWYGFGRAIWGMQMKDFLR